MPGGFKNKPKILRGAFVEFGLSIPPLFVVFQFNPVHLTHLQPHGDFPAELAASDRG